MLQEVLRFPSRLISVMITLETTFRVILAVLWTVIGGQIINAHNLPGWFWIVWGAVLVLILVTFCEILPKAYFASTAERTIIPLAPMVYFLVKSVYWLSFLLEKLAYLGIWLVTRRSIKPKTTTVTEEDLLTMVSVGEDEGVIEEQEREMIHSIFSSATLSRGR